MRFFFIGGCCFLFICFGVLGGFLLVCCFFFNFVWGGGGGGLVVFGVFFCFGRGVIFFVVVFVFFVLGFGSRERNMLCCDKLYCRAIFFFTFNGLLIIYFHGVDGHSTGFNSCVSVLLTFFNGDLEKERDGYSLTPPF